MSQDAYMARNLHLEQYIRDERYSESLLKLSTDITLFWIVIRYTTCSSAIAYWVIKARCLKFRRGEESEPLVSKFTFLFITDKPLSKHYSDNLDLDGLKKARNLRMTQRPTKRLPVLCMWCHRRQEEFVNLDLFQTATNYSSYNGVAKNQWGGTVKRVETRFS